MESEHRIERLEKKGRSYFVYVAGKKAKFAESVIIKYGVFKDKTFSAARWAEIVQANSIALGINAVIGYLAYGDRSQEEINRYLTKKGYNPAAQAEISTALTALGYLDDARVGTNYCKYLVSQNIGPAKILQKMRSRGFPEALTDALLAEAAEAEFCRAAQLLAEKKARSLTQDPLPKQREKLMRYLLGKGFTHAQITAALADLVLVDESYPRLVAALAAEKSSDERALIAKYMRKGYPYEAILRALQAKKE